MVTIDASTQLCAVIGNPVAHSLSPAMHNAAFAAAGLNWVYLAFQVEDVAACLAGMRALRSFRGLSVTIPHKLSVMEHLDAVDPMARHVGCVNTITREGGRLVGSLTDGEGTLRAFHEAGVPLAGKRVLFLGAGGAVRAVAFAIAERETPGAVTILGRTLSRVEALASDLEGSTGATVSAGHWPTALAEAISCHDVVIQGTPVGMYAHGAGESCVPSGLLRAEQVVFDMVYRPLKTRLIEEAEAAGCRTILGLEMLVNQAALQFERWTGIGAPREVMRAAVVEQLGSTGSAWAGAKGSGGGPG